MADSMQAADTAAVIYLVWRAVRVLRRRVAESRSSCMTGSQWLQLLLAGFFMLLLRRAAAVSCPKLLNSFIEAEKKKFNFKNFSKFRSWGNINVESTMILRKSSNVKQYSVVKTLTVGDTCKVFEQQVRKVYCRPLIFYESVLMFFLF